MSASCWNDALVVTDRHDARRIDEIIDLVKAGATALVTARCDDPEVVALTGVAGTADLPRTEWFVTLADAAARVRLDDEVAVTSALRPLRACSDGIEVAATTSIRFAHQPTVMVRSLGAGRVVTTGITDLDAVRAHPTLRAFFERLLRPAVPKRTTDLGVGVVGYGPFGGMGYLHGLAATETDGLALVAAADSAPERIDAARADCSALAGHAAADSLANDPAVDIAGVAAPPARDAQRALQLLRAGRPVRSE